MYIFVWVLFFLGVDEKVDGWLEVNIVYGELFRGYLMRIYYVLGLGIFYNNFTK